MSETWTYRDAAWSEGDVIGYDVEAVDGSIGKVDEATAETDRAYLVVDTGFWIFGKKRLIPAGLVTAVDHDARTLTLSLSKAQVKGAPDHDAAVDDDNRYSEYYGPYTPD
jgi:hypothetical protein